MMMNDTRHQDSPCCGSPECHSHSPPERPVSHAHAHPHAHEHGILPLTAGGSCCHDGVPVFDGVDPRYKLVLWIVIALNGAMFLTEIVAGHLARSQALQADALDFLADTVTYGLSLAVIGMSLRTRAVAALFKGLSLTVMGAWVLGSTAYHVLVLGLPRAEIMGVIGILALVANLASVGLLLPYKDGDANVRSVWLCSRNDAIGNVIVMVAAGAVWVTSSAWPDLLVAAIMAGLFLTSAVQILRRAWDEYRLDAPARRVVAGRP
nr:cation transporter [Microvirga brassicacearum]